MTAITNAVQCYNDISYLQRVYNPPLLDQKTNVKTVSTSTTIIEDISTPAADRRPSTISIAGTASPVSAVTPLSARTFGTWNIVVGIVRLFAAYHLHEKSWYQMSILTNVVGFVHFSLEAFVYKTAQPRGPWFAPVSVALIGLVWHAVQYNHYIK